MFAQDFILNISRGTAVHILVQKCIPETGNQLFPFLTPSAMLPTDLLFVLLSKGNEKQLH